MIGYRVTAQCDTCLAREMGFIMGRDGTDDARRLLAAMSGGWAAAHGGHQQIVMASPATLTDLDGEEDGA